MTRPEVHVALATDRGYLPWCATAALSCVRASPDVRVVVHLQTASGLTGDPEVDRLRGALAEMDARLDVLPLDPQALDELPAGVAAHGGAISCARMLLPDLLPDVDRLLYLDADTLTVRSVAPLFERDLAGALVAAVLNVTAVHERPRLQALGLRDSGRYFNSGVLVLDLAAMRRSHTVQALLSCLYGRRDLLWVDQDALNLVLEDDWCELEPSWNAQNSLWSWPEWAEGTYGAEAAERARAQPVVLHFEGPSFAKPWHYLSPHPWTSDYRAALARTPWARAPLVDRTVATMLISRLPQHRRIPAYLRLLERRARAATPEGAARP